MFGGFPEETIRFFLDLRFHNDAAFFHAHQDEYMQFVREPFYAFIDELAPTVMDVAADMETRPHKCLSRIHRDTRFSNDKSPYRDHLWIAFRRVAEPKESSVMYWFELGPEFMNWGLGFWGSDRGIMDAFRKRMVEKPAQVKRALRQSGIPDDTLQIFGDRYKRMPPPAGMALPLAMLYPMKSFYVQRVNTPFTLCYQPELIHTVAGDIKRLKPMYTLLRSIADEAKAQLDG